MANSHGMTRERGVVLGYNLVVGKKKRRVKRKWSWNKLVLLGVPIVLIPGILFSMRLKGHSLSGTKSYYADKVIFPSTGVVAKVIDGDTIELKSGAVVRLLAVNAPNRGKDNYEEAKKLVTELVLRRRVWLEYDRRQDDKYGRILAWVWVECERTPKFEKPRYMYLSRNRSRKGLIDNPKGCVEGKLVNEELLKAGMAELVKYGHWGELKYEGRIKMLK